MKTTDAPEKLGFESINRGYNSVFTPNRLSIGLVVPIENYSRGPVPEMTRHLERVQWAEELGFSALWIRDVPFNVPSFGDAGQLFDPFVYLGLLAGKTDRIALGVASIILPLRHPVHVAKAASSVDTLSGGRLILGVASGDRPEEYPAMNIPYSERSVRFRESFEYIKHVSEGTSAFTNSFGQLDSHFEMLPKPVAGKIPLLITGGSQQDPEWIANHGDGWMIYPRNPYMQKHIIHKWREGVKKAGRNDQPVLQPLYVDLADDPDMPPIPIHLGFRLGVRPLLSYLKTLESIGINHVALNLRFNKKNIESTLKHLAEEVLPAFN